MKLNTYHFQFFFHLPRNVNGFLVDPFNSEDPALVDTDLSENRRITKIRIRIRAQRYLACSYKWMGGLKINPSDLISGLGEIELK